jgi:hypothetical protein
MRVTAGYGPYAYGQQAGKTKSSSFADVYANTAANKPAKTGAAAGGVEVVGTPVAKGRNYLPFRILASKVDTTRKLNMDSTGEAELTEEQIQALKGKYGFDNPSLQNQYDLYCDLTDMGVLSAADVDSIGMSNISLKGKGFFSLSSDDLFPLAESIPNANLQEWMQAFAEREQAEYDYMLELEAKYYNGGNHRYDASLGDAIADFRKNIAVIEGNMASHKKVARIVSLLSQMQADKPLAPSFRPKP